jgi:hypothetical protein
MVPPLENAAVYAKGKRLGRLGSAAVEAIKDA